MALNAKSYLEWLEGYCAAHPEDKQSSEAEESGSNFLAGAGPSKSRPPLSNIQDCFLHPKDFHSIKECPRMPYIDFKELSDRAKKAGKCFKCLEDWAPGHICTSLCRHCERRHPTLRCGKERDPPFRPATASQLRPDKDKGNGSSRGKGNSSNTNMLSEIRSEIKSEIRGEMAAWKKSLEKTAKPAKGQGKSGAKRKQRSASADNGGKAKKEKQ